MIVSERSVQIKKDTKAIIIPSGPNTNLDAPLWAINWFDLKKPKLYTFYNQIAFPHVKKVKGRPHFKGYAKEKIEGDDRLDRKMLLIVKYPSADSFLRMISNKIFLLKSILRIKSVDRFIFGFQQRFGEKPEPPLKPAAYVGRNYYMVYHFERPNLSEEGLNDLKPVLARHDVTNYYSGTKMATIAREITGKERQTQPFFIHSTMVLEAAGKEAFVALMEDPDFLTFKKENEANSLYYFKRLL